MIRPSPLLLVVPALLWGCGEDDPGATRASTPTPSATPSPSQGVTETVFNKLELRAPREEVEKRLGEPVERSQPNADTECLDYPALDAAGKPLPNTRFRVCFNTDDQLSVRTTVGSAG